MRLLTYQPLNPEDGMANTATIYDYYQATMIPKLNNNGFIWDNVKIIRLCCYVKFVQVINFNFSFSEFFAKIDAVAFIE